MHVVYRFNEPEQYTARIVLHPDTDQPRVWASRQGAHKWAKGQVFFLRHGWFSREYTASNPMNCRGLEMTTTETIIHYAPGDRLICGPVSTSGVYTDDPYRVSGCEPCVTAAAEDLADVDFEHGGRCLHCRQEITATGGVEWRRVVRALCPHCGRAGW